VRQGDQGELRIDYSENSVMTIHAVSGDYTLRLSQLDNWTVDLAEGDKVTFLLDLRRDTFIVRTAADNSSNVKISTTDGFSPSMNPDSSLSFILGRQGSMISSLQGSLILYETA